MKEIILAVIAVMFFAISLYSGGDTDYCQTGLLTLILAMIIDIRNQLKKNDKL